MIFDHTDHKKFSFWNTAPPDELAQAKKRGGVYRRNKPLMPDSPFPVGEHLGKTMRQVPPAFLRWVDAQPWADAWEIWQPVRNYLDRFPLPEPKGEPVRVGLYVDPAAAGLFKGGACCLHVTHEDHLPHLHAFADGALHLRREWFRPASQSSPPHYLLTPAQQETALGHGVELIDRRTMMNHVWLWQRDHGKPVPAVFDREMPDGTRRCTKHCYGSEHEANTTRDRILSDNRFARNPYKARHQGARRNTPDFLRSYYCERCGFWHLTRQAKEST